MGDFFRGWRRRISVVTLLMACVFMAGWVRSSQTSDWVEVNGSFWRLGVEPILGHVVVVKTNPFTDSPLVGVSSFPIRSNAHANERADGTYEFIPVLDDPAWQVDLGAGIHFSDGLYRPYGSTTIAMSTLVLPYWFLTVPLSLFSLWLLVSTPHKSTPNKTSELISDKGRAAS